MFKKLVALMMAALMLVSAAAALAEAPVEIDLSQVPEFLFRHFKDGLGLGYCPIYTAPSTNLAFRALDGKAGVSTDHDMYVAGKDASGWLLVRYGTYNNAYRVGYIPRSYASDFKEDARISFSYITCEAPADLPITDDPLNISAPFGVIPQGGVYAILARYSYHGDWWYVETKVEGKFARGFIPRSTTLLPTQRTVVDVPDVSTFPQTAPDGSPLQGTVTVIGDACLVRQDAGTNFRWVARARSYDIFPCYGEKIGTNNHTWYYVCVNGTFGWIAGTLARVN